MVSSFCLFGKDKEEIGIGNQELGFFFGSFSFFDGKVIIPHSSFLIPISFFVPLHPNSNLKGLWEVFSEP
jgi:hypothetical protein